MLPTQGDHEFMSMEGVCFFMLACKYMPEGNMCTGEEGQLCPINSLTPLHSPNCR